jgi:hypothetical protein
LTYPSISHTFLADRTLELQELVFCTGDAGENIWEYSYSSKEASRSIVESDCLFRLLLGVAKSLSESEASDPD